MKKTLQGWLYLILCMSMLPRWGHAEGGEEVISPIEPSIQEQYRSLMDGIRYLSRGPTSGGDTMFYFFLKFLDYLASEQQAIFVVHLGYTGLEKNTANEASFQEQLEKIHPSLENFYQTLSRNKTTNLYGYNRYCFFERSPWKNLWIGLQKWCNRVTEEMAKFDTIANEIKKLKNILDITNNTNITVFQEYVVEKVVADIADKITTVETLFGEKIETGATVSGTADEEISAKIDKILEHIAKGKDSKKFQFFRNLSQLCSTYWDDLPPYWQNKCRESYFILDQRKKEKRKRKDIFSIIDSGLFDAF